jgi:transcriptional regulator NrdR family protein
MIHDDKRRPNDLGIKCPSCGHQSSTVKDSRPTDDCTAIRRRRMCLRCGTRSTTFERFAATIEDRDAAERGAELQRALESCPVHQRRLVETLIFQMAADANRIRDAEAADIVEQVGDR